MVKLLDLIFTLEISLTNINSKNKNKQKKNSVALFKMPSVKKL